MSEVHLIEQKQFIHEEEFKDGARGQVKSTFAGTEEYVSPEILKSEKVTLASDLWSFGVILYWLFTGRTPFKKETEFLTFENILQNKYAMSDLIPTGA